MQFTTGVEFYSALAKSDAFTKGISTRLVNYMLAETSDSKKAEIVSQIVSSNPKTWQDVLLQILFSEEYLLNTPRAKSIEELAFPVMKKLSYNTFYHSFYHLSNEMHKMGQLSMSYKLGRAGRVPVDNISFATSQKYLRDNLFRAWSRDTVLSVDPKKVDDTHNSDFYMSDYKGYYRRGISSKHFMVEDNYEVVEDDSTQTIKNFINYVFNSTIHRDATPGEVQMFLTLLENQSSSSNLIYVSEDQDRQAYIRYVGRYYTQYLVFEYLQRLDELYFFKEVK
jgi:hypothetical protein